MDILEQKNKEQNLKKTYKDRIERSKEIGEVLEQGKKELTYNEMAQDLHGNKNLSSRNRNRLTFEKYKKLKTIKEKYKINIESYDFLHCKMLSEIDLDVIEETFKNGKKILEISNKNERSIEMLTFYSKLSESGFLNNFCEIFDKWTNFRICNKFEEFKKELESYNFVNIKNMKSYIKSKNENTIFDYDAIDRLNSLESIEYVGNILLKGIEKGGENYVILNANKLGTDYIRAEKQGENEYIINAHMPDKPKLAGRSYILLLQCLPKGAKIDEKESLSINSFNNIIHLYSNKRFQEKLDIKEVVIQNKVQLNNEGEDGELAKLIKDKNIGKDIEIFETDSKDNAELIVNEINKLIYKYIGDGSIHAEVKEIEKDGGDNTWGIELPSYRIEKL